SRRHTVLHEYLRVLVDSDLPLPGLDQVGDVAALLQPGLRPDLIGDAELLQQLVDVDATRTGAPRIDVAPGLRLEQRRLEAVDRGNVGLRRALLDHDTDADL